ncbi:MAG TPA: universal stress protein [Bacteroidia bacterium]|jgi:nucleotide-binding universal stress UspA family protein|nr:universal stress protein [Bacteroidia bacterium]
MSTSTNSILVPIDGTEQSVIALNQSYNLAQHTDAKIVLLSVEEETSSGFSVQRKLAELAKEATEKSGQPVETMIRKGNVYEEISKVADVLNPLVMVGLTTKLSPGTVIGKNAFKMVRGLKSPVMTIRGKSIKADYKTILLPLDLTKESREKVDKAIVLAKRFNATIRVVSVLTSTDLEAENKLIAYSNQVWRYLRSHQIRSTVRLIRGSNPAKIILEYGRQIDADIIVITSKSVDNVKEFFTGTVAEQLINESEIPVITYHPIERKDTTSFLLPY